MSSTPPDVPPGHPPGGYIPFKDRDPNAPPSAWIDPLAAQAQLGGMSADNTYRAIYGYDAPDRVYYASWGRRVLGYLVDSFLGTVASIGVFLGYFQLLDQVEYETDAFGNRTVSDTTHISSATIGVIVIGVLISLIFNVWNVIIRQGSTGYSLGKTVVGIRLVKASTGQPMGPGLCFVRQLAHYVDSLICYLGWLWPLWDARRQTIADKIMGTVVIIQAQEQAQLSTALHQTGPMSTILITGASSGLGAEMARQFAARGHDLALCARRTDRLEELKAQLLDEHPDRKVGLRALDVTDDDQVFEVFRAFRHDFGRLDRVVVNAGVGKGAPLGTGRYAANRETAMTNFVAALAQAEAAMEIFREQDAGHLVLVSSMSAMRGMPKSMTVYAATKAALSHLGEGLQYELMGKPIKVTVLHCGYIASEMNERVQQQVKFMVSTEDGVRSMVDAIEKQKAHAYVPALPWTALAPVMKHAPLPILKKLL